MIGTGNASSKAVHMDRLFSPIKHVGLLDGDVYECSTVTLSVTVERFNFLTGWGFLNLSNADGNARKINHRTRGLGLHTSPTPFQDSGRAQKKRVKCARAINDALRFRSTKSITCPYLSSAKKTVESTRQFILGRSADPELSECSVRANVTVSCHVSSLQTQLRIAF